MHVIAAMSGGVDSAVAAALLLDAGHQVTGVFMRNGTHAGPRAAKGKQGCCSVDDAQDAARVADLLDVPFYALDFEAEFDTIVADFADEYARGRTPNPCIQCNRDLKFGRLMRFADAIGADAVATGHYARCAPEMRPDADGLAPRHTLRIPTDEKKDQTYVLFPLSQETLARTLFPLGELRKAEVRAIAGARGLPVHEKPESMEICFVPDGDYRAIVAQRRPDALQAGPVVVAESRAVVGEHAGIGAVTMGQRRGLGIASGTPLYVTGVDLETNTVLVGERAELLRRVVEVDGWNAVSVLAPEVGGTLRGHARVRRTHVPQAAVAIGGARPGEVALHFDEPVAAPAPGQALVLYDDDGRVLGGGWIRASHA